MLNQIRPFDQKSLNPFKDSEPKKEIAAVEMAVEVLELYLYIVCVVLNTTVLSRT